MKRRTLLQVEELGERIMPSAPAPTTPLLQATLGGSSTARPLYQRHHLQGAGIGRFTRQWIDPSSGVQFHLRGTGTFNELGRAKITGDLQSGGSVLLNQARGTIILTNAEGSLTLAVTASLRTSSPTLPSVFQYRVVSGTGAYTKWRDSGWLDLKKSYVSANVGVFHLTIR